MTRARRPTARRGRPRLQPLSFLSAGWIRETDQGRSQNLLTRERADAVIQLPCPMLFGEHKRFVELAARMAA